jgi:hypothetical protein
MKKNILYGVLFNFLLLSCSGGGDEPVIEPQNAAPSIPNLISPSLAKLCINNTVSFEWSISKDAEKHPIVYQLQIATDNQFTQIVNTSEVSNPTQTVTLDKGKAYYWRVKATDSKGASSAYSSTYSFYTEGTAIANHVPFAPQLVSPTNNSLITGTATTLKWSGSDVDATDTLSFDVYLGTDANPTTKIVENKTSTSVDATLLASKIYYWKVVVRDNKGGETMGQIWSFKAN